MHLTKPTPDPTPLSAVERAYLATSALESAGQLAEKSIVRGGTINWVKHATQGDIKVYSAHDRFDTTMFCGVLEMGGVIGDAIDFFSQDNGDPLSSRAPPTTLPHHDVQPPQQLLDVKKLYTSNVPKRAHEHVDVVWRSYRCPLGEPVVRDMCLLEFGRTFPVDTRLAYVNVARSIDLTSCPPQDPHNTGVARATNHGSGTVVFECERQGVLRVAYVAHIDYQVHAHQQPMARKLMEATCVSELRRMELHLKHVRTLRNQRHPGLVVEIVPKTIRRHCHTCASKFASLSLMAKRQCSHCGEVVCATCHVPASLVGTAGPTKFNLCLPCVSVLPPAISRLVSLTTPSFEGDATALSRPDRRDPLRKPVAKPTAKWWRTPSKRPLQSPSVNSHVDVLVATTASDDHTTDTLSELDVEHDKDRTLPPSACDDAMTTLSKRVSNSNSGWGLSLASSTLLMATSR